MLEFKAHFKSVQPDLGGSLPGQLIFGIPGKDGGYYTIQITQPSSDTMRLTFPASKEGMEQIDPADILLPKGPKGEPGEVDMDQILRFVAEYLSQNPPQVAEKDPTVPDWAKEETKPSYSKSEVGLGNVDNVRQYSASNPPPYPVASVNGQTGKVQLGAADVGARPSNWMPTAQEVGALPDTYVPPDQTAAQVGADPAGTAAAVVSAHNTSTDSHGDLRLELKAINDRLTAFFDSDNQTLDELSEIVAYITSNKALIDSITTSKVSVADIINNLTTNVANKPLSAAQGVALKDLIDAVSASLSGYQPKGDYALASAIPTKVSQLQNDKGYLTEHQDISGKLDADKLPEAVNTALAQAKASGEFDGDPGAPGVTPHIGTNGNWYIGSADTGVKAQGKDGTNGTSVTVESVSESTADGGSNVVTFSNGKTLNVKNGSKGNKGDPGTTPQKGIDFWTPADQEAIVQQVITALGTPVFGRVDADNNIILTGELADGIYTIKYEDAEGNVTTVGTLEHDADAPTYTNQIPISLGEDGTVFDGVGYRLKSRINSSGAVADLQDMNATKPAFLTGLIPVKAGDVIRLKNCFFDTRGATGAGEDGGKSLYGIATWNGRIGYYTASYVYGNADTWTSASVNSVFITDAVLDNTGYCRMFTMSDKFTSSGYSYIRLGLVLEDGCTIDDAIVTKNEEIS